MRAAAPLPPRRGKVAGCVGGRRGWTQAGRSCLSGLSLASVKPQPNFPRRRRRRRLLLPASRSAPSPRPAARPPTAAPPTGVPLMLPEDGSGLHISKLPRGEGKRGKKKKKKERKGSREKRAGWREGEVGCTTANHGALLMGGSSYAGRSKVSELRHPLCTNTYSKLCLWPVPPPPSPFNLRKPYRQLTVVSILLTYSYSQGQDPGCF